MAGTSWAVRPIHFFPVAVVFRISPALTDGMVQGCEAN